MHLDLEDCWSYSETIGLTMFVFGLLAWIHVVAIQVTHPNWLMGPLTHYEVPPFNCRVDDIGILSFAVAAFGFFMWQFSSKPSAKQTSVSSSLRSLKGRDSGLASWNYDVLAARLRLLTIVTVLDANPEAAPSLQVEISLT